MSSLSPLNSLISTAVRMQAIRRDSTMSHEVKDKLLAELEKRNADISETSEIQSKQAVEGRAVGGSGDTSGTSSGPGAGGGPSWGSRGMIVDKLA